MSEASTHTYFAYGSNLNIEQMRRRCPSTDDGVRATLFNHELIFPVADEGWSGGVASVKPVQGAIVEGVLYQISDEDFVALDGYEAVEAGLYRRELIPVHIADDQHSIASAWIYLVNNDASRHFPPSRQYLKSIVDGARHHKLPPAYIEKLCATGTVD